MKGIKSSNIDHKCLVGCIRKESFCWNANKYYNNVEEFPSWLIKDCEAVERAWYIMLWNEYYPGKNNLEQQKLYSLTKFVKMMIANFYLSL